MGGLTGLPARESAAAYWTDVPATGSAQITCDPIWPKVADDWGGQLGLRVTYRGPGKPGDPGH